MGDFSLDLKAVLTIIAIITAIVIAYTANWWRNRKKLSYEIITVSRLLTDKEEIKDELHILYKGEPVSNVQLLVLKLINDGNQPITKSDFEKPLKIVFSENTKILSTEIVSVNPSNLEVTFTSDNNSFSITPLLLNKNDFIRTKILLNADEIKFKVDARITGVEEVNQIKVNPSLIYWLIMVGAATLFMSSILGAATNFLFGKEDSFYKLTLMTVSETCLAIAFICGLFLLRIIHKKISSLMA